MVARSGGRREGACEFLRRAWNSFGRRPVEATVTGEDHRIDREERRRAGWAGLVAAGSAVGISELIAGLFGGVPSLLVGIGGAVIDRSPSFVKDLAISLLGAADKPALAIGTVVISLVIGWFAGIGARRRRWIGWAAFAGFGLIGWLAAAGEPLASGWAAAASVAVSVAAGLGVLEILLRAAVVPEPSEAAAESDGRRRFLVLAGAGAAAAATAGVVGRRLLSALPEPVTSALRIVPDRPVTAPAADQLFDTPGIAPLVVPNGEFYRIDTALVIPRIEEAEWTLRIHGAVDREVTFSYDDLLARDLVEKYVTIACVSNQVGGSLVGNAAWTGVPLTELLTEAGVTAAGTQLVGRSIDGFTTGFPTELAFDGREPLVAIGMNGVPLPRRHGFPARLIVPGLYGYVSATKWLTEIELTGWDDFDAYWIPRGWSKEAPIKTQSRIDIPRTGQRIDGTVQIAGVAWAPTRGIAAVEVRIDDGPWTACEVTDPLSDQAWVQWRLQTDLPAGDHQVWVRATDGGGAVQTDASTSPRPDGATGHHSVRFSVA